jgi:iron complex transport system ATP-binding protein
MIRFQNTQIGYATGSNKYVLIDNLNISAGKSENIALIGINGSGKSTLLKTIAGLINIIDGDIYIHGKHIHDYFKNEAAQKVSFVSSEIISTRYLKVFDLIYMGRFPYRKLSKNADEDIIKTEEAIQLTGTSKLRDKNIDEISDGERQKVMIARALAQDTEIILMDEPTSFLDINNKFAVFNILNKICKDQAKTIIFSTHDLNLALKYADKVWLIKDKQIHEGAPEDLIINGLLNKIFDNENIKFNYTTSEFTVKFPLQHPVNLINKTTDENIELMTGNALYRKGFYVSENEEKIKITILENKHWKIQKSDEELDCQSIYSLLKILSMQNL